jgi:hypothetical protein
LANEPTKPTTRKKLPSVLAIEIGEAVGPYALPIVMNDQIKTILVGVRARFLRFNLARVEGAF